MDNLRIQRAILEDLDDLLPLFAGYRTFYQQQPDADGEHRFLHDRLANHESVIFIARHGQQAVGFAQLFATFSSVHLQPAFILEDLFVHADARKLGVAAALLERAKLHAREWNAAGMFPETAHANRAAQRVYERAGWQLETQFRKYNCPLR
ncbi:MAG: GNAT family N-acetyltransferase [Candidatus Eremiobacteraeota bacterium]|nr:GNAT family N-acetyltransferase [Candidatus Eremiobacteraeota bacterium]